ncbi:hypothetical protein IQ60_23370 [Streptomyces europaeiscabiei]|nr:hypothetical protein IQ60_23370 [Streptomyces europaeiscabiei]
MRFTSVTLSARRETPPHGQPASLPQQQEEDDEEQHMVLPVEAPISGRATPSATSMVSSSSMSKESNRASAFIASMAMLIDLISLLD